MTDLREFDVIASMTYSLESFHLQPTDQWEGSKNAYWSKWHIIG